MSAGTLFFSAPAAIARSRAATAESRRVLTAMVFVKDLEAMAQFYRDGFDLTDDADASEPAYVLLTSEATRIALRAAPECEELGEQAIKGRVSTVRAYRVQVAQDPAGDPAFSSGSITGGTP